MRVITLKSNCSVYTCNVYVVLGTWSTIDDVNTLVDTGSDASLLAQVKQIYTGVGKNGIDRVILTHNHFDHVGGLSAVVQRYKPEVYAFAAVDMRSKSLNDGQMIRIGDRDFEVIHTPGHSSDSICLYCKDEQVLFSGDTPIWIKSSGGMYENDFVDALERLSTLDVETIYPGHGSPVTENAEGVIQHTLTIVKKMMVSTKK